MPAFGQELLLWLPSVHFHFENELSNGVELKRPQHHLQPERVVPVPDESVDVSWLGKAEARQIAPSTCFLKSPPGRKQSRSKRFRQENISKNPI